MVDDVNGPPSPTTPSERVSLEAIPLHSTNLLTVLDEDGVIQFESPAIEHVFGFEQGDLVHEQVADYFHPEDRTRVADAFQAVVSGEEGTVESVEYRHRKADGTYCWVESVSSASTTPEGYYVVNTREISEQKARERTLRETNERLDQFTRALSHDLRNPLQVARGRLELAIEDCDSEHLPAVDRAHDRMQTLIEELLALARNREAVLDCEPVELRSVVSDCWRNVETGDATVVAPPQRMLLADRSRLQQLLENLIRNAVEHGGDEPRVTVDALDTGFYVEDDGPGIPEDIRRDVLEAGYSTSRTGSGFGLSIVAQIVGAHGWELRIDEGKAGGARFEVTGVEFADR
ncbi:ATP-binding protein [Halobellus sp. GM3]|uniref:ATP-binding protein n=1 Tax=Halobellus sp. GM3 TaxID=3458410 RepID=UPI00403D804E